MSNEHPTETNPKKKSWHACHECNLALGAKVPKGELRGVTMTHGKCPYCGEVRTLIPHEDYHWPKEGRRAVWD